MSTSDTDALLDAVGEDTDLSPAERETTLRFSRGDDSAVLFTAERGLGRRLLQHPEVETRGIVVARGDARPEIQPEAWDGERVVGVRCTLPLGCLLVRRDGREYGGHSDIVTQRVMR